ncbi:MAG: hypothetical protein AAGF95_30620 [Chloroflexota bacterium]
MPESVEGGEGRGHINHIMCIPGGCKPPLQVGCATAVALSRSGVGRDMGMVK